jgi:predicted Zn-dependent peptidase
MKKLSFVIILLIMSVIGISQNNPLNVETYKLKNGLTVYLNVDHTMPMVHGMVVTKGGAKRDPADATGVAHYFEHIMFKGTDKIGTVDYAKEKVYLDSISDLYDKLGQTTDKDKCLEIQKEINRISIAAADYTIPNEVDKILGNMGGKSLNAGTSYEYIVYYNSFPSNQINKWLEVYYERFRNPVFRLFQSELETIYEEKNMYADDPIGSMFEKFYAEFYPNSAYGQHPIIGTTEHLKNPSISKMQEYYDKYYVAKNMALILSGDFDLETVKPIIEEKFGKWQSGSVPPKLNFKEKPFKGREFVSKRLTPIKIGVLGFRTCPKGNKDELALEVCANILSNGSSTGLLDKLHNDNKIMFAGVMNDFHEELGGSFIFMVPKIVGQSLKSAEKEVMAQLQKLKAGDFSDSLFNGVKTEMKKTYQQDLEDMRWRTYAIMDAFVYGESWSRILNQAKEIDKLTKEDIIKNANKYYGDNYLAFYSKMGFPKKDKIDKPPFKSIPAKNSEAKSDYAKNIEKMPTVKMEPKFIDFKKDVNIVDITPDIKAFVTPNPINDVFSLRIVFGKGSYNDPLVDQVTNAFEYLSPKGESLNDFKNELQLLGCSYYAYNDLSKTTINISGLEENLDKTIALINKLFTNVSIEQKHIKNLYQDYKMEQKFEKKDVSTKSDALADYALYGNKSGYLSRLTTKEVKNLTPDKITDKLNEIKGYQFELHYCGKIDADKFVDIFKNNFTIADSYKKSTGVIELPRNEAKENTILFVNDKKAIQSHIDIFVEGKVNNEKSRIKEAAFNDYVDGSMASIIFQEIREFRSLAYGAWGRYRTSFYFDKPGYFKGGLTTQADKTTDALEVYDSLLKELPQKPNRIEEVRNNLTLSINAQQPSFRYKSMSVSRWLQQGYTEDPRKTRYSAYKNIEFNDIMDFYKANIKGKPWMVTIVGDKKRINMKELSKYGKITEIKTDKLFSK